MKRALFTVCSVISLTSIGVLTYVLLCEPKINSLAAMEVGSAGFISLIVMVGICIFNFED